jgi:hypothetical protein
VPQVDPKQLAQFTRRAGSIRGVSNCLSSQLVYVVSGTMKSFVSGYIPVVGSIDSPERDVQFADSSNGARIHFVDVPLMSSTTKPSSVGYQPIVTASNFGAVLEIRPTLMPMPDSSAVVDLKSTVTVEGDSRRAEELKGPADDIAPAVDRMAIETLEFATTLRIPLKKPVLVGGLTYIASSAVAGKDGGPAADSPEGAAEKPQLYLVLEVK